MVVESVVGIVLRVAGAFHGVASEPGTACSPSAAAPAAIVLQQPATAGDEQLLLGLVGPQAVKI